jgi:hypothetical protein
VILIVEELIQIDRESKKPWYKMIYFVNVLRQSRVRENDDDLIPIQLEHLEEKTE